MSDTEIILERLERLSAEVAELRAGSALDRKHVLTVAEARGVANQASDSAFYRWAEKWRVAPCGKGRYARRALVAGLEREANGAARRMKRRRADAEVAA